jgi:predicted permease
MDFLLKDLRHAGRMLRKTPGSTAISIIALGMGIGLSALMFSIIYGAVWRGLPFDESEELMYLESARVAEGDLSRPVTVHDFTDWRAQQRTFEDLAAFNQTSVNLSGGDRPERYRGARMTSRGFALIGDAPHVGRTFTEEEDQPGGPPVVVIGYHIWRDRFESDPGVLGKIVRVNGEETTIIGVMPERFRFPVSQDLWLPLRPDPNQTQRGTGGVAVFGRLRDDVTIDQARRDLDAITTRLAQEYPTSNEGVSAIIKPYTRELIGAEEMATLIAMFGGVLLVLLMACANVANLLMSRAASRIREVAVRCALGASKMRIALQFLSEAFLLAIAGAAIGLSVAQVGITLFNNAIAGTDPPFWIDIRLDAAAFFLVLTLTLLATLVSGTLPALQAARANINNILKDEARGSSSFRIGRISRWLVVLDIALSCGLLVGAGLMIRSVVKLGTIEFPFPTEDVLTASLTLPELEYPDTASRIRFVETLEPRLHAIPGVTAVALTAGIPGLNAGRNTFAVEGVTYASETEMPSAARGVVIPSFFATFEVSALQGRLLSEQDRQGNVPVAVVNQSFARRFWPGEDPLGKRIRFGIATSTAPWLTVVGVVPDLYVNGVQNENPEGVFVPLAQNPVRTMSVVARSPQPLSLVPGVRAAVASIDPNLPLFDVNALATRIHEDMWFVRVFGALFMVFGFVALLLAAIGLYGVMSFSVGQRTREVGVRMALGAKPGDVLRMIMRQGTIQLAFGLAFGLTLAFFVSRFTASLLFGVSPRDPATFIGIVAVLTATTGLASLIPALRATRVDPLTALRHE